MMEDVIRIKKLRKEAIIPRYASDLAAGADLCACLEETLYLEPGETVLVHTGIALMIPEGFVGLVFARSGLAAKKGVAPANKVGVIDADYRGEIMAPLFNHGKERVAIEPGERIAQIIFTPILKASFLAVDELEETKRGAGGFGSTGSSGV